MEELSPITVALSARPVRSVVFVPTLQEVSWQALFRFAIRVQTASWGGFGNLVLPMPGGGVAEDEVLWAVLDAFDADVFARLMVTVGDLEELAPEFHADYMERQREHLRERLPGQPLNGLIETVNNAQLVHPLIPDELQDMLIRRVAPLSGSTGLALLAGAVSDPPNWPLVPVEKLRPQPKELRLRSEWPTEDLALMGALAHGELSLRLRNELTTAGVSLKVEPVASMGDAWRAALEERYRVGPRELSLLGLAWYSAPGAPRPDAVLCVGEAPWDFAVACALDRMGIPARWVPEKVVDDPLALHALVGFLGRIRQSLHRPLRVCSVSSDDAPARLLEAVHRLAADLPMQITAPLELVPAFPHRLYEHEQLGYWQSMFVHRGLSPDLATPLPRNVEPESPDDLYWMTDIKVEGWAPIRHSALSHSVVSMQVTEGVTRCGRDGVSYLCPGGLLALAGSGLESQRCGRSSSPYRFTNRSKRSSPLPAGALLRLTRASTCSSPLPFSAALTNSSKRSKASECRCSPSTSRTTLRHPASRYATIAGTSPTVN